jgi:hypothetical protein
MTGSITGNTTAAALASAGNFRYNSDETITNYSKTLGSRSETNNGINVIYREKPVISVKINDVRKSYDGQPFNGGTASVDSGTLHNGDTATSASTFAGNAQGAVELGDYNIEGGSRSALGYDITYTQPGKLTIFSIPGKVDPVVPVPAPSPNNNTVVVAGGSNSFQLAGAEATCSADTLELCECESATSTAGVAMAGVQICYEPKNRPSSAL